jgi:flagellar hook protein FlgE
VDSLSGTTSPDEVVIDTTSAANTLANLADAINGTGTGTNCSTGTVANPSATASASGTTLTLTASQTGTPGNSIATTSTWGTFGAATLTGGTAGTSTASSADSTFSEPLVVYDSLGNSHTVTFTFTKTAANTWSYQITIPAADIGGTGKPQVLTNGSGTLQFDGKGNLISPSANVTDISIPTLADGAKPLTLTWNLFDPATGAPEVTQVAGQSNVASTQQDGYGSGALQSFTINSDGIIQGAFSNGQTLNLGRVALATFQNTQGLQLNGANTYVATPSAGVPSIGGPSTGGRGTIVGQSLEASNVDMTTELSDLIMAERDYQSNARAISTADQMINYVLTMQP